MFQLPPTQSLHPQHQARTYTALLPMLIFPFLGACLGYLTLTTWALPQLGLGGVDRIVKMGQHLDHMRLEPPSHPYVVFVGNSVVTEGVDANWVERAAKGFYAENFGVGGCGVNELRIALPKILTAKPDWVVVALGPTHLYAALDIPVDKAYAYAIGGFVESCAEDQADVNLPGLSPRSYEALQSNELSQVLHFRTAVAGWINDSLRYRMRRDLRPAANDDFRESYELLGAIPPVALQGRLNQIYQNFDDCLELMKHQPPQAIDPIVDTALRSGASVMLVIPPHRPQLNPRCEPLLTQLQTTFQKFTVDSRVKYVDAHGLLPEELFADEFHPNEEGRRILSEFLGQQILAHHSAVPSSTSR